MAGNVRENGWDTITDESRPPGSARLSITHTGGYDIVKLQEEIDNLQDANKPLYVDEKEEHFYEVVQIDKDWVHISVDGKHAAQRFLEDCQNGTVSVYLAKRLKVSQGITIEPVVADFEQICEEKGELDSDDEDALFRSYEVVPLPLETDSDFGEELIEIFEHDIFVSGSIEDRLYEALDKGATESAITELAKKANLYTMKDGMTLLHVAACHNRSFICILLYAFTDFARIQCKQVMDRGNEHCGLTAGDIACKLRHDSFLRELKDVQKVEGSFDEIHRAARVGDVVKIRDLVKNGADVNAIAKELQITPLYMACGAGRLEAVKVLLELGADVMMRSGDHGGTCLHRASEWGHYNIVRYLINERCFDDINIKNIKYEHTALHRSVVGASPDLMEFLLNKGAAIDTESKNGVTPLHYAVSCSEFECVAVLLSRGADALRNYKNNYNIIHHAVQKSNLKIFRLLVKHISEKIGQDVLKRLTNATADLSSSDYMYLVRGTDRGKRAWHYVQVDRMKYPLFMKNTNGGSLDVVEYGNVVKSGWGEEPPTSVREEITSGTAQENGVLNSVGNTHALHLAARDGSVDVIDELMKCCSNINVTDEHLWTPIHFAAAHGKLEAVLKLVELDSETNACDKDGCRPLYYAILNEQKPIIGVLQQLSRQTKGVTYKTEEMELIRQKAEGEAPVHDKEYCKSLYSFGDSEKQ
ncbi:uncharacterized protein LOC144433508 [Glandiceps talaboti]